jgi:hypothetical protein
MYIDTIKRRLKEYPFATIPSGLVGLPFATLFLKHPLVFILHFTFCMVTSWRRSQWVLYYLPGIMEHWAWDWLGNRFLHLTDQDEV